MVRAVTDHCQVPPDVCGPTALALTGGAITYAAEQGIHIHVAADWVETPNLYVMVSYPSGGRKSKAFKLLSDPITEHDFHAFRHLFISRLARAGVSPKVAQTLARHSTISLTMDRYTHIGLADPAVALEQVRAIECMAVDADESLMAATGTDDGVRAQRQIHKQLHISGQPGSTPGKHHPSAGRGGRSTQVLTLSLVGNAGHTLPTLVSHSAGVAELADATDSKSVSP